MIEAIRKMVISLIKPTIHVGTVISVDESKMTCEIDLTTAPDIKGVRIRAAIDEVAEGLLIIPKVGSVVLIARIEEKIESSVIVAYTEIESMNITTAAKLMFNGDSDGGLVISSKVSAEDNTIKQDSNTVKNLFSTWVPVVNDGGASLKAHLAAWYANTLTPKQPADYESNKNLHGS